ncbi:Adaptor protein complex AP-2 alpha subunit [Zopfochytrium polystomum]|nr:Adaptor protein complex AP-2 alpha subunit [Zopfochytrium polystomum]
MSMRGLTVFIADLRNCRARDLEEKRVNKEMANIRAKFKDSGLNGYQKKKYVAKLIYMYILGWDVDFGHAEAVQLLQSSKYSEKQIGYLACTLLLSESSDLMHLVVNSLKRDLASQNEVHVCLALHAIANVAGREMAEVLSYQVQQLLVEGHQTSFVRKKAALCLLRLYRKHPDFFQTVDWAPKIVSMLDDHDFGTVLATATLITTLAQTYPQAYARSVEKGINRLAKINMDREYSPDYVYYDVPVPWLQVRLLRLLQYYPPPGDLQLINKLSSVLQNIIHNAASGSKNIQRNNAQNALLFEAINLCIHLDPESVLVEQSFGILGNFISAKETNVRYLALETMCHLAATGARNCIDALRVNQETIISSLKDRDISVRRRAVDLLYSMCDETNVRVIVAELLRYLQIADYAIRDEMVLKIAILTEKFAMEYSWYVDVILQLITIAGDHISDDIWFRVIQIITNNEDLQVYAATTLLAALNSPACHETTLKVGGYVLGEFGHFIANNPGCSPIDQFTAIHSKYSACTPRTRALLLTTYLKFVNLFPEIKDEIVNVFKQNRHVLDTEISQRAKEYLAIVAEMQSDEILQTVCVEMPVFPERESALVKRLQKETRETEDKRTWVIGGRDANAEMARESRRRRTSHPNSATNLSTQVLPSEIEKEAASKNVMAANRAAAVLDDGTLFRRLVLIPNGLLHRDPVLELGLKSEYRDQLGRLAIFFGNRSLHAVSSLSTALVDAETGLQANSSSGTFSTATCKVRVSLVQPVPAILPQGSQLHQLYKVECLGPADPTADANRPLSLAITFNLGAASTGSLSSADNGNTTVIVALPIPLTKFVNPVELTDHDFFSRWRQIGGPPREAQVVFPPREGGLLDRPELVRRIGGLGFKVLEGLDQAGGVVGAGILSCVELGKVGCMVRLEVNQEHKMYRCTVRTTNEVVSHTLRVHIEEVIVSSL